MISDPLDDPVPHPWRRYLRFSARGLIVLVLLIGGGLGWVVRSVRSARIQRGAVAAIVRGGGSVKYNWEWPDGNDIDSHYAAHASRVQHGHEHDDL
jgi:hypothetical protein